MSTFAKVTTYRLLPACNCAAEHSLLSESYLGELLYRNYFASINCRSDDHLSHDIKTFLTF